jgi:uncharacterized membrane protein YfcA
MNPADAVETTGTVLAGSATMADLWPFFRSQEGITRSAFDKMRELNCVDNPVMPLLCIHLTKGATPVHCRPTPQPSRNDVSSASYSVIITVAGIFAAALLRGYTGFGFGLAAVPLLSLALPPVTVVPIVIVLQVAVGFVGLRDALPHCEWRSIRILFPGLLVGVPLGFTVLSLVPANPVRLIIGLLILASVGVIASGVQLPRPPSRIMSFVIGMMSGISNGLASMGGPPIVVYLLATGHAPAAVRATSIVYFLLAAVVAATPMALHGMIDTRTLGWAALCLPGLVIGARLGGWMFLRSSPRRHRQVALLALSALALLLISRVLLV